MAHKSLWRDIVASILYKCEGHERQKTEELFQIKRNKLDMIECNGGSRPEIGHSGT